jgi:hypothetical protein
MKKNTKKKIQMILENIAIKILDYIVSFDQLRRIIEYQQTNFHAYSENIRKHIVKTIIRFIRFRKFPQQISWEMDVDKVLKIFGTFKECLNISFSSSASKHFPESFESFTIPNPPRELLDFKLKTIEVEFKNNNFSIDSLEILKTQISNFFIASSSAKKKILIYVFYFYYEINQAQQPMKMFDNFFNAFNTSIAQYQFIPLFSIFDNLMKFIEMNYNSIENSGRCLSDLIWKYEMIPFEIVIAVLFDNDNSFNISMLEFLLMKDNEFKRRFDSFMSYKFEEKVIQETIF